MTELNLKNVKKKKKKKIALYARSEVATMIMASHIHILTSRILLHDV